MSEPLRIGFVVEGPTDRVVLESVVAQLLGEREFEAVQLTPLLSETFRPPLRANMSETLLDR